MRRPISRIFLACLLIFANTAVLTADGGRGSTSDTRAGTAADPLGRVRGLLEAKQWYAAIQSLQELNATRDPDWNNLMGYALRKADPPDLAMAEKYYSAALAIDPKYRGALEYLGELRLQQGDLPGAEKPLATLRKVSFFKSREFKDLEAAIERYKAAGNRYVPED